MNNDDQVSLIYVLAERLKETARELLVYQLFAQLLKRTEPLQVEETLGKLRQSPEIQAALDTNFEGLDALLPPLPGKTLNQDIQRFFEKWNPTGQPN